MEKGDSLVRQGRFNEADQTYTRAASAAVGSESPIFSTAVRIAVGKLRYEEGRLTEAEQIWNTELKSAETTLPSLFGTMLLYLGDLYTDQNRLKEAESTYFRCVQWSTQKTSSTLLPALAGLGRVHLLQRRFSAAIDALEQASSLVLPDQVVCFDAGMIRYRLGLGYSALGRNKEAEAMFLSALNIGTELMGPSDARLVPLLISFSEHLKRSGQNRRAKELMRSAKQLRANHVDPRRHTVDIRSLVTVR